MVEWNTSSSRIRLVGTNQADMSQLIDVDHESLVSSKLGDGAGPVFRERHL